MTKEKDCVGNAAGRFSQLALPTVQEAREELVKLPTPVNIGSAVMGKARSTSAPLILWALACARASGLGAISGSKIAQIINQFAEDDHHKVEPTNISRLLRGPTLGQAHWLGRESGKIRDQVLFRLADGWREVFEEDAPDV